MPVTSSKNIHPLAWGTIDGPKGVDNNSWASKAAAEWRKKNHSMTFYGKDLKTILDALEGWRSMIDDEETPNEDRLIEAIRSHEEIHNK